MARSKPLVHDLGEYGEIWDVDVLQELLPYGWKLWRIHRAKDQDTWRSSKPGFRYVESRHFQTVMCKVHMIENKFLDKRGNVL